MKELVYSSDCSDPELQNMTDKGLCLQTRYGYGAKGTGMGTGTDTKPDRNMGTRVRVRVQTCGYGHGYGLVVTGKGTGTGTDPDRNLRGVTLHKACYAPAYVHQKTSKGSLFQHSSVVDVFCKRVAFSAIFVGNHH